MSQSFLDWTTNALPARFDESVFFESRKRTALSARFKESILFGSDKSLALLARFDAARSNESILGGSNK